MFAGTAGTTRGEEVSVDTPAQAALANRSIGPNPAVDHVVVTLSLPRNQSASLEMIDLAGRRVRFEDLGGTAAGQRQISLDGLGGLSPGPCIMRLTAAGKVATSRLMLVR